MSEYALTTGSVPHLVYIADRFSCAAWQFDFRGQRSGGFNFIDNGTVVRTAQVALEFSGVPKIMNSNP